MGQQVHRWRPQQIVRPIALGIVWRDDSLLLDPVCQDDGTIIGWRPPGGEIEFGERAIETFHREFMEELGEAISEQRLIGVLENHYEHHDAKGHEIVFVFEARFVQPTAYDRDVFRYTDGGIVIQSEWVQIRQFREAGDRLLPDGLVGMLNFS